MGNGKKTCKILKEIRAQIAAENDISYVTSECKHQGDCAGTCPKCEAEVRYLEKELEKRARLGKAVTIAGLAAAITATTLSAASCDRLVQTDGDMLPPTESEWDGDMNVLPPAESELDGDMPAIPTKGDVLPYETLPDYDSYAHLISDTDALYSFLKDSFISAGYAEQDLTFEWLLEWMPNYIRLEESDDQVIAYFDVHSEQGQESEEDSRLQLGLVFTRAEQGSFLSFLWTAVTLSPAP